MEFPTQRRPPRSARPGQHNSQDQPQRPQFLPSEGSRGNVSFQNVEQGDRHGPLDQQRQRTIPPAYQNNQLSPDAESLDYGMDPARVGRKKSLVRPDREKIEPGHRQWHYRSHVAQLEEEGTGRVGVIPSSECKNS